MKKIIRLFMTAAFAVLVIGMGSGTRAYAADSAITVRMEPQIELALDKSDKANPKLYGEAVLYELSNDEMAHRIVSAVLPDAYTLATPKGESDAPEGTEVTVSGVLSARRGWHNARAAESGNDPVHKSRIAVTIPFTGDFAKWGAGEYSMKIPVELKYGECYGSYSDSYDFTSWEEMEKEGTAAISGTAAVTSVTKQDAYLEISPAFTTLAPDFAKNAAYREVWIPPTVTDASYAMRASSVEKVIFAEGFTEIPMRACYGAKNLKEAVIPEGVETMHKSVFYSCGRLTKLPLPSTLKTLEEYVFYGCTSITEADLPASLEKIGVYCFENCSGMRKLAVNSDIAVTGNTSVSKRSPFQGCSLEEAVFSEGVTAVTSYFLAYACEDVTKLALPSTISVIQKNAFNGCSSLQSLSLPASLTSLGASCFAGGASLSDVTVNSDLKLDVGIAEGYPCDGSAASRITFAEGVTKIPGGIFDGGCSNATEVYLPTTLKTLGSRAFRNATSLKEIIIRSDIAMSYLYNREGSFANAPLEKVVAEEGVTKLPGYIFMGASSSLKEIILPETLLSIGASTFDSCGALEELVLPKSLKNISENAFKGAASLKSVHIRSNLKLTKDLSMASPFTDSGLEEIIVDEGVTSIPGALFEGGCARLVSLYLPTTLTTLGSMAFNGAASLKELTVRSDIKMKYVFFRDGAFKDSALEKITVEDGVTKVPGYIFTGGCANLRELDLPDSLVSVGPSAFDRCPGLEALELPGSMRSMGEYAFRGAESLKELHIRSNLKVTKDLYTASPFAGSGLEEITVDGGVTKIPDNLFAGGCSRVKRLVLPETVTGIGCCAFEGCEALEELSLPASLQTVDSAAFKGCASLTELSVNSDIAVNGTSYGYPFSPGGITAVRFKDGIPKIGALYLSNQDNGAMTAYIPKSVTSIDANAFKDAEVNVVYGGTTEDWAEVALNGLEPASVACSNGSLTAAASLMPAAAGADGGTPAEENQAVTIAPAAPEAEEITDESASFTEIDEPVTDALDEDSDRDEPDDGDDGDGNAESEEDPADTPFGGLPDADIPQEALIGDEEGEED